MIEHRTIEKVLTLARKEAVRIETGKNADPLFVEIVVDFIRTYADRTHHGKEEEILFRKLKAMPLGEEDRREMAELVEDHRLSRQHVKALSDATERYRFHEIGAADRIVEHLKWLADFYPVHIEKEDKSFFPRTERYFDEAALNRLLQEFYEFDQTMIHEKYNAVVDSLSSRFSGS
jgi:hemerythrin-like domain-containing protein